MKKTIRTQYHNRYCHHQQFHQRDVMVIIHPLQQQQQNPLHRIMNYYSKTGTVQCGAVRSRESNKLRKEGKKERGKEGPAVNCYFICNYLLASLLNFIREKLFTSSIQYVFTLASYQLQTVALPRTITRFLFSSTSYSTSHHYLLTFASITISLVREQNSVPIDIFYLTSLT